MKELFEPKSIAVVGASRRKEAVGYAVLNNVRSGGFKGNLYAVNAKADEIDGMPCHKSLADIGSPVDLAVIVVPSVAVIDVLQTSHSLGVKAAIVITAGFREIGPSGKILEDEIVRFGQKAKMPILGPNCLGLINADPNISMNASFSRTMPQPGNIAFVSQSGALCTAILDYAKGQNIGFSKFMSLGNKAVLNEIDMLRYLKDDPETDVILMYLEDLSSGRGFIELAREMTGDSPNPKPILAIKAGRTSQGAKAAQSHTGSLMSSDEVYDAIFAQAGVLRVDTVQEMFNLAVAFANQPIPTSKRVAILTNAGGPGILATDACIRHGLELAHFENATKTKLQSVLPPTANCSNPVDVIGDAQHGRYEDALEHIIQDPNVDSSIVILTPQAMTDIEEIAQVIVNLDKKTEKTLLASFMGISDVSKGVKILEKNFIPHYPFPEDAARSLASMTKYASWISRPRTRERKFQVDSARTEDLIQSEMKKKTFMLRMDESLQILRDYGFPTLRNEIARSKKEAVEKASQIGFPVTLKIISEKIVHKMDMGGVKLNLKNEDEVETAYQDMMEAVTRIKVSPIDIQGVLIQEMAKPGREVILGMKRDPGFGPILMFGLGGIYVEALKDVTFRLAPIRELGAKRMIEEIKSFAILKGVRGEKPCDLKIIQECLERLSQLVCKHEEIVEMDINPLMVYSQGEGAKVLDARIILKSDEGR